MMKGKIDVTKLRAYVDNKIAEIETALEEREQARRERLKKEAQEDYDRAVRDLASAKKALAETKKKGWEPEPEGPRYSYGRPRHLTKEEQLEQLYEAEAIINMLTEDAVQLSPQLERLIGWNRR